MTVASRPLARAARLGMAVLALGLVLFGGSHRTQGAADPEALPYSLRLPGIASDSAPPLFPTDRGAAQGGWPSHNHDSAATRWNQLASLEAPLELAWSVTIEGFAGQAVSVLGDTIALAGMNPGIKNEVRVLNRPGGTTRCTFEIPAGVASLYTSPALLSGLFVSGGQHAGSVHAASTQDCAARWSEPGFTDTYAQPLAEIGGYVIASGRDRTVVLDRDGASVWPHPLNFGGLTATDGEVLFVQPRDYNETLRAVDLRTGNILWSRALPSSLQALTVWGDQVISGAGGATHAFGGFANDVRWVLPSPTDGFTIPDVQGNPPQQSLAVDDTRGYRTVTRSSMAGSEAVLQAFDPATGEVLWSSEVHKTWMCPPVVASGFVYTCLALDHTLVAFDAATGEVAWERTIAGRPESLAVAYDALYVVATREQGDVDITDILVFQ